MTKPSISPLSRVDSRSDLKKLQREMAGMLYQPLTPAWKMRKKSLQGKDMAEIAKSFIKPNDRLSSFERLEIYNRCYWARVIDSLYDDFPGLLSILGNGKFFKLVTAYLTLHPSESFTLRNLGSRLESFVVENPQYTSPRHEIALDMVRFEWAQILAFDGPSKKPVSPRDIQRQNSASLRFGLQPYLTLLELNHAVDQYIIALKNHETDGLRSEASNTSNEAVGVKTPLKRPPLPRKEKVWLAVHRHDNVLYFKRLAHASFVLLRMLQSGATLEEACRKSVRIYGSSNLKPNFQAELTVWFADWSSLGWLTPLKQQ